MKHLNQHGFTLAEVLVAITILLIVAIAFMPLSVFITKGSQANKAHIVATKLASGEIEKIRGMQYEDVGTVGGNPEGNINPIHIENVGGVGYTIETKIWWVEESGPDTTESTAYKKVQVAVSSPSAFTGKEVEQTVFGTLVSKEGEKTIVETGNIKAEAYWRYDPIEDVRMELSGDGLQTGWTDENGVVIFGYLDEGNYTVTASHSPMMVKPLRVEGSYPNQRWSVEQTKSVEKWKTTPVRFDVDYPINLKLNLLDGAGNIIDPSQFTNGLKLSLIPEGLEGLKLEVKVANLSDLAPLKLETSTDLDIWPDWDYDIKIESENNGLYQLSQNESQLLGFSTPNNPETIDKTLTVKVSEPIANPKTENRLKAEEIEVNLSALPGDSLIFYSYDGITWIEYGATKPVINAEQTTFYAFADKNGMLSSDIVTFKYVFEESESP